MTQNSNIDEANEDAESSSHMLGIILLAVGFPCLVCLIAAALIMMAKAGM